MEIAGLFLVTFVGTVCWPLNPEAAVVLSVTSGGLGPFGVALVAALGQAGAHALLWVAGARIRRVWPWFDRQCVRARARWGARLVASTVPAALSSGLLGLPPTSATAVLSPGLGLRPALVLPVMFASRIVRFGVLCLIAAGVLAA